MEEDPETQDAWLQRLYALNSVIAACGERIAGSICYEHHQDDYLRSPPIAANRGKRERFRRACEGRRRMLEIGVNGGHSAYIALTADPSLEFHGVDIADHSYVRPVVEWLKQEFPGRIYFYEGSCLEILPRLAKHDLSFDLFHIDGAKHTYYQDILNCHRLIDGDPPSLVIIDDLNMGSVDRVWRRCLSRGLVRQSDAFPEMPAACARRNAVGLLERITRGRWWRYRTLLWAQSTRRRFRASLTASR